MTPGPSFIEKHAARPADRQAEIHDKVIDTIDVALDELRSDLKVTKLVRQPDGSVTEQPAWHMTPKDLCLLIDRLEVLSGQPAVISQHQGLSVTSELPVDSLREFIEATRGRAGPSSMEESPLPRRRPHDDQHHGHSFRGSAVELLIILGYVVIPAAAVIASFTLSGDADSAGGDGMVLGCLLIAVPLWPLTMSFRLF